MEIKISKNLHFFFIAALSLIPVVFLEWYSWEYMAASFVPFYYFIRVIEA